MLKRSPSGQVWIRPSGILDGSRAMEIARLLHDQCGGEVVLDFSAVEGFEPFGVEVLALQLAGAGRRGGRISCRGLPPCVAERMREIGVAVAPAPRHPRWAP